MQITRKDTSPTSVTLTIVASQPDLDAIKKHTLEHLRTQVKLPGFREGKAPLNVVEKNVDQARLQSDFLDEAVNHLYGQATQSEKLRTLDTPQVSLKKFVPFSSLEFEATVSVLGPIKLGDYKKIKKQQKTEAVTAKDVNDVIDSLRQRAAEKRPTDKPAKAKDEALIDFTGVDAKNQPINGADGKDYPLVLGSDTFIPGFETNIIGMKAGEVKTFTLTFPKDYGVKALANKKVTFTVTIKQVNELAEPKLDDEFAAKVGPFKTVTELKSDIKKQLTTEKENQARRTLENEIIQELVNESSVDLPQVLVDEQIERLKTEVRQNLTYRGQTWQEMLEAEGKTEEEFTKQELLPEAERRVKTGLILSEVSVAEKLEVTPEELEIRMQILKSQYTDPTMQAELEKPESRQEIASRIITEKTVERLVSIATSSK